MFKRAVRLLSKTNSFFRSHAREIFFFGIGFFTACVLWVCVLLLPSCRGAWTWDFKAEAEDKRITTKVDFVESVSSVGCDGISENEFIIDEGGVK